MSYLTETPLNLSALEAMLYPAPHSTFASLYTLPCVTHVETGENAGALLADAIRGWLPWTPCTCPCGCATETRYRDTDGRAMCGACL